MTGGNCGLCLGVFLPDSTRGEYAYILISDMKGNETVNRVLIIGGPNPQDGLGEGVTRIDCTSEAILGLHIRSEFNCIVYWPTRDCLKPLLVGTAQKAIDTAITTIEAAGVDYETFMRPPPRNVQRGKSKKGVPVAKTASKVRTGICVDEVCRHAYRATRTKLLEILVQAHSGLICICVVPEDLEGFPDEARGAFNWVSRHLDLCKTRHRSGIRLDPSVANRNHRLSRFLAGLTVPIEGQAEPRSFEVGELLGARTWGEHVSEIDRGVNVYGGWLGNTIPVVCQAAHMNGQLDVLSLAFFTGTGGVVLIPQVLGINELLSHLAQTGDGEASTPSTESAEPPLATDEKRRLSPRSAEPPPGLDPPLVLTTESRRIRNQQGKGYIAKRGGKSVLIPAHAFYRLLAFTVAAKNGQSSIDICKPMIGERDITDSFGTTGSPTSVAQRLALHLKQVAIGKVIRPGPGSGSCYRLAVDPTGILTDKLRGSTDCDIKLLMSLLRSSAVAQ